MTVLGQNLSAGIDAGFVRTVSVNDADFTLIGLVVVVLISGVLLHGFRLYKHYRRLAVLIDSCTPFKKLHGVQLLFSSEVTTPFSTLALGTKQIVLPYQLLHSPANLALALKHELQHVRNGDLYWVLMLELLKPVFFWNPAWYLWLNEFHCLQEYACDEALLGKPCVQARNYGNCLLEVASQASANPVWAASNMVPHFALFRSTHSQLKRRILMLDSKRKTNLIGVRASAYAAMLLLGLGVSSAGLLAQDDDEERLEYLPQTVVPPKYPVVGLQQELIGWVQVMFDVDPDGGVSRIAVRDHCVVPQEYDPTLIAQENGCLVDSSLFDEASLEAIAQFTFEPRLVDGVAVTTRDVQYLFRFTLENGSAESMKDVRDQYKARHELQ